MAMKNNNEDADPLDMLFQEAKQQQEQVAATVELGVESRLSGQLTNADYADDVWIRVLSRLCGAGGLLAVCLLCWVASEHYQTPEVASLLIERWLLGI